MKPLSTYITEAQKTKLLFREMKESWDKTAEYIEEIINKNNNGMVSSEMDVNETSQNVLNKYSDRLYYQLIFGKKKWSYWQSMEDWFHYHKIDAFACIYSKKHQACLKYELKISYDYKSQKVFCYINICHLNKYFEKNKDQRNCWYLEPASKISQGASFNMDTRAGVKIDITDYTPKDFQRLLDSISKVTVDNLNDLCKYDIINNDSKRDLYSKFVDILRPIGFINSKLNFGFI